MINTKDYWEERLSSAFNLGGVGYQKVGENYNYWIYRLRFKIVKKIIKRYFPKSADTRILDVGSGTGFYLKMYLDQGYQQITGVDITELSVSRLKERFPQLTIIQNDISENVILRELQRFDVITCFDVLFHIIDPERYYNAFKNLYSYLNDDGILIFSENFSPFHKDRDHIVDRTKSEIESTLTSVGFEIISKYPLFFFLNPPRKSENKLLWKISDMRVKNLSYLNSQGYYKICYLIGLFFYMIDSVLQKTFIKGTGTEIVISKK